MRTKKIVTCRLYLPEAAHPRRTVHSQHLADIPSRVHQVLLVQSPPLHVQLHAGVTILAVVRTTKPVAAPTGALQLPSTIILPHGAQTSHQALSILHRREEPLNILGRLILIDLRFFLDAQRIIDEVLLGLFLMDGRSVLGYALLGEVLLAEGALDGDLGALGQMLLHAARLYLLLADLAGDLDFRDDLAGDARLVPLQGLGPAAGALAEPTHDVLDARLAVDLGAALRLDCVFGQLEADRTCEALLYIHENYKVHS